MTERELVLKIVEAVLATHRSVHTENMLVSAVLDTLEAADVRLTLPYRWTPPEPAA